MRRNAIIRIVLYSLAILVLLSILGAGLGIHLFVFRSFREHSPEETHIPEKIDPVSVSGGESFTTDSANIQGIEIDWVSGSITIEVLSGADSITVSESEVADPDMKMICRIKGDTLQIDYCREAIRTPNFGFTANSSKDLVIQVPDEWLCASLEIETASADVTLRDLTIRELDLDGASGRCNVENCTVTTMDVDVASGDVTFCGSLENLDFDGASSDCHLILTNCPRSLELDGMSGNLELTLPSDCGFTAELEGLSSQFSSDFQTSKQNGKYVFGDGSCRISVEAMSGSVHIYKGNGTCHNDHQ